MRGRRVARRSAANGRRGSGAGSAKRGRAAGAAAGLVGAALSAAVWLSFRRDARRARRRVSQGSFVVETPAGRIEYGTAGEGPPLLVVHGAGGGFDQGLEMAAPLVGSGFRVVAMSRFGYLRTPLPADASPAAQADAHAALLDVLGLRRVAVVGASAGAPSSMQFALRHPGRTAALVLLVPAAYPLRPGAQETGERPRRIPPAARFLFDAALGSDFLFWLGARLAPGAMLRAVLGTPPSVLRDAGAEERARIERVLEHVPPLSLRRKGLRNDMAVTGSLPRYELERIAAPTLVVGVADCLYGTWEGARHSADHIPGARFVGFPTGGHLWVGHDAEVRNEIVSFLQTA
jgi:2-hydroxy-6-oxonona-2,4-dienedioate hydrolase